MNNRSWFGSGLGAMAPARVRDRVQWGGYGFAAGLLLGLILGVFFYGIVSFLLRYGLAGPPAGAPSSWLIFVVRLAEPPRGRHPSRCAPRSSRGGATAP
jgi:hypothetical protein